MKKSRWIIGVACLCAGAVWIAFSTYHGLVDVDKGEHVTHLSWLPPEASDICYFQSYSFTAAEFHINEEAFKRWCASRGYPLQQTHADKPFRISRYSAVDAQEKQRELAELTPTDQTLAQQEALAAKQTQLIMQGLFYRLEFGNGGGVAVAFDPDSQTGYFESSPR